MGHFSGRGQVSAAAPWPSPHLRPAADHGSPDLVPTCPPPCLCLCHVCASCAACVGRSELTHLSFSSALPMPLPQALLVSRSDCECSQWEVWKRPLPGAGALAGQLLPACPWGSPHAVLLRGCHWFGNVFPSLSCDPAGRAALPSFPSRHRVLGHPLPSVPLLRCVLRRGSLAPGPGPHCLLHVQPSLLWLGSVVSQTLPPGTGGKMSRGCMDNATEGGALATLGSGQTTCEDPREGVRAPACGHSPWPCFLHTRVS